AAERCANTRARVRQPSRVMPQPISALNPYGASEDGSRKMPMPITLPTTSAVQVQKPIRWRSCMAASCSIPPPPRPARSCRLAGRSRVCRAQQVLEMPHAALALRVEPARTVGAGSQPALHRFADADVLVLHLVAEAAVGLHARLRRGVLRVVVVEHDAAAIRTQRQDAV